MADQPTSRRRRRKKGRRKKRKGIRRGPKARDESTVTVDESKRRKERADSKKGRRGLDSSTGPVLGPPDRQPQRRRSLGPDTPPVFGPPDTGPRRRRGTRKGVRRGPGKTDIVGRTREQRKARFPGLGPRTKAASIASGTRAPSVPAVRDRGTDVDERKLRRR